MKTLDARIEIDLENGYSGGGQIFIPPKGYQYKKGILKKFMNYLVGLNLFNYH